MLAEAALMCLALNAYWEARNQDFQGMIAVNQVVMNRVESEYYPDTPCEVVMQGPTRPSWNNPEEFYPVRHKCQFSWYCDGKSDKVPESDKIAWDNARMAAFGVYYDQVEDLVDGSLWYHAHYVKPEWAKVKEIRAVVGDHIFYGWNR